MSEDKCTSQDSIPSRKTRFISRSDDEDSLWAVHEITEESAMQYKVKWVGTDPHTGKPWPQSWVSKSDCTDDLVTKWEAKMKSKEAGHKHKSSRAGGSIGTTETRQPRPKSKRKWQSEEDVTELTDSCDGEDFMETAKEKPSKRHKKNLQKEKAPFKATPSSRVGKPTLKNNQEDPSVRPRGTFITQSPHILPRNSDNAPPSYRLVKVGPPRGVRKEQPARVLTNRPKLPTLSPTPTSTVRPTLHSRETSLHASPIRHHSPGLSPSTCASLEVFDWMMAEPDRAKSPEVPEVLQRFHQQQEGTTEEERPNIQQTPCTSTAINAKSTAATETDELHPEDSRVLASSSIPDLPGLLAKVEEIKRLQCTISIAANATLKLGMEVIDVINALQGNSQ